jgi:hypothetical protein
VSFLDLPDDWTERPLTDPRLVADVLDLVMSDADRLAGCLAVVMCDEQDRVCGVSVLTDPHNVRSQADKCRAISVHVEANSGKGGASLLFALGRPDGLSLTPDDEHWAQAARQECTGEVRLLGFHVVTRDGSRQVPGTTAAA